MVNATDTNVVSDRQHSTLWWSHGTSPWVHILSTKYVPFKWLYSHWLNTASLTLCKYFLFARRWCWQCWLIIISWQHHHQSASSLSVMMLTSVCITTTVLWGYYHDVILSLRITVLLGYHRHGIRVPHHGLSTAVLMEFNHCLYNSRMFAYMQIIISAAAAADLSPFTYHTELLSPWKSAGLPDWRWFTLWTNETFSLHTRLLKKKWQGGGRQKNF